MNKTLYVKDSDAETWEKAEKLAPDGISGLVTSLLKEYVLAHQPPDENGFERIEVEVDSRDGDRTIKKAFTGRYLLQCYEDGDWTYDVAITKRGKIAVYSACDATGSARLDVLDSLEDLKRDEGLSQELIALVSDELNQPYTVELDI